MKKKLSYITFIIALILMSVELYNISGIILLGIVIISLLLISVALQNENTTTW